MSGGRWGYQSDKLDDIAGDVVGLIALVARIEHHLDWGSCGDTCWTCAKQRAIEVFEAYFDQRYGKTEIAWRDVETAPYPNCEHR